MSTERLVLREFTLEDATFILHLLQTPNWLEYIGDKGVRTLGDARLYITESLRKSYKAHGFGLYLIELKSGIPMGMCGLVKRDYLDHPDIGFALLPEFQSQGFGFEAAHEVMNYARKTLGFTTIFGITLINNKRSICLLEKLGLKEVKTIKPPNSKEEVLLFSTAKQGSV